MLEAKAWADSSARKSAWALEVSGASSRLSSPSTSPCMPMRLDTSKVWSVMVTG